MPGLYDFNCSTCDLKMTSGWGGYTYAIDQNGERQVCRHPCEVLYIEQFTGMPADEAAEQGLIGQITYCICADCLHQFSIDLDRDIKVCPTCESLNVKSVRGLVGYDCPQCEDGKIVRKFYGMT